MRESTWLKSEYPRRMLDHLRGNGSPRKLRLFACACGRALEAVLSRKANRTAVETAERFADGQVPRDQLRAAQKSATPDLRAARYRDAPRLFNVDDAAVACAYADAWLAAVWASIHARQAGLLYPEQRAFLRDIFANPFRPVSFAPSWRTTDAVRLATVMYQARTFHDMPILADALEDAGCDNADMLAHCRGPGPHVRGCWVVDLLLGKE